MKKRNFEDPIYKNFRKEVRRRDKVCQFPNCGSCAKLHVHHIIGWASSFSLRYQPRNGILLCKKHHDSIKGHEVNYIETFNRIVAKKYEDNK